MAVIREKTSHVSHVGASNTDRTSVLQLLGQVSVQLSGQVNLVKVVGSKWSPTLGALA